MRKTYKIEVDCPTCAAKLQDTASKVDGVESCTVNQIARKMKKIDDDVVIYF